MAVKYVNGATGLCVVRCSREQYRNIWASITFITHLHNVPVLFNLLNLSGKAPCCCRHPTSVIMMIALLEASRHL
jgi:ribonuclease P/MRP protein subunit POP5